MIKLVAGLEASDLITEYEGAWGPLLLLAENPH